MARYKTFAGPFGKVFLGAVLVYQVIYWTWLKLEMDESKLEKNGTRNSYCDIYIAYTDLAGRRNVRLGEKGTGAGRLQEMI